MTDEESAQAAAAEAPARVLDEALRQGIRDTLAKLRTGLAGFVPRREQNQMIAAVARALATSGGIGVIEAPTGVGKSLAYLIAGVPAALASGKTLVISTGTVALQAQLIERDIPAFLAASGIEASVAIAKGRTRYLCPRNLAELEGETMQVGLLPDDGFTARALPEAELVHARQLERTWSEGSWNGDLDAAPAPVSPALRARITTPASACPGRNCALASRCPVLAARVAVREAQIVVTNHALLLAALALGDLDGGQPIIAPPGDMLLVIDEAHHLADVAIGQGAAQVLLREAAGQLARMGSLVAAIYKQTGKDQVGGLLALEAVQLLDQVGKALKAFHVALRAGDLPEPEGADAIWRAPGGRLPTAWKDAIDTLAADTTLLQRWLAAARQLLGRGAQDDPARERLLRGVGMAQDVVAAQAALWEGWRREDPEGRPPMARWVSLREDGDCACHCSPVAAADVLRGLLWDEVEACVLTSATLTGGNGFGALAAAIGLPDHAETLALGSPFDLPRLAELVVPRFPVAPDDRDGHPRAVAEWLARELDWEQGSLVLFTSRWKMTQVAALLPPRRRLRALVQGEGNKSELIAEHLRRIAAGEGSVLFGLNSFGEGLDLPGAACTTVVITQVPFAVPTDPQTATLSEWIESRGHSAFNLVAVPHALRMLTQFAGRLVRGPDDHGRVVILDSRLLTRRYGRRILDALPPFRRVIG